jgi:hypothetical protein
MRTFLVLLTTYHCSDQSRHMKCVANVAGKKNFAMGRGVRVTKLTGSRTDELIYWWSFTIAINYDSLQSMTFYDSLLSLLDHEHLPFFYNERRISAHTSNCTERCLALEKHTNSLRSSNFC